MSLVLTSPEDVINDALVRIGRKQRIGSIQEGSESAKVALDIYGQTRDEMLRDGDWGFVERNITIAATKQAPTGGYATQDWDPSTNPPIPWWFQYTYPSDCLKVRSIKVQPIFLPNFDPQPIAFKIANDNGYSPARKVILCNVGPSALMVYAAQIIDPSTWEASFTEALCAALARRLAPALANLQTEQAEATDEQVEAAAANMTQG